MTRMTIVCLLLLTAAQGATAQEAAVKRARFVAPRDPVQDYWDREGWASSRYYGNIDYSSKEMDALSEKIQKLLGAAGAKLASVSTFRPEPAHAPQRQRARRNFSYKIPAERIEEVTKKLSALAPVDTYNGNFIQNSPASPAREIQERVDAITAEMAANKEALKNMPVALALYASKLERLRRAQENLGESDELLFNISVVQDDR